ncbi:hypothetical protein LTR97_012166 [Elasticomyces elasticus]|uniref:Uncharacterized protein n=1 Tax=Elasticomyces elasticus TaxID=574655 RepID=A0AAN7VL26_9PEZI|nr:hypothetical protein LTR97_012166 [Elasticomyces elasticus]
MSQTIGSSMRRANTRASDMVPPTPTYGSSEPEVLASQLVIAQLNPTPSAVTESNNATPSKPSLLLELPAPLRNRICELLVLLVNGEGKMSAVGLRRYQMITPRLRIAQANRKLRGEVLPAFYGVHLFRFVSHHFLCIDNCLSAEGEGRMLGPRSRTKVEIRTTPVLESSLVCFGFTEPDRYPKRGQDVESGRTGNFIELPTFSLRKLVKRVELVLEVPIGNETGSNPHLHGKAAKPRYTQSERDWLYPLRHLRELGFLQLTELKVVVNYGEDIELFSVHADKAGGRERLEEWVSAQITAMSLENVTETVEVEYAKVEPWLGVARRR